MPSPMERRKTIAVQILEDNIERFYEEREKVRKRLDEAEAVLAEFLTNEERDEQ